LDRNRGEQHDVRRGLQSVFADVGALLLASAFSRLFSLCRRQAHHAQATRNQANIAVLLILSVYEALVDAVRRERAKKGHNFERSFAVGENEWHRRAVEAHEHGCTGIHDVGYAPCLTVAAMGADLLERREPA